jgi:hypothetical protein
VDQVLLRGVLPEVSNGLGQIATGVALARAELTEERRGAVDDLVPQVCMQGPGLGDGGIDGAIECVLPGALAFGGPEHLSRVRVIAERSSLVGSAPKLCVRAMPPVALRVGAPAARSLGEGFLRESLPSPQRLFAGERVLRDERQGLVLGAPTRRPVEGCAFADEVGLDTLKTRLLGRALRFDAGRGLPFLWRPSRRALPRWLARWLPRALELRVPESCTRKLSPAISLALECLPTLVDDLERWRAPKLAVHVFRALAHSLP